MGKLGVRTYIVDSVEYKMCFLPSFEFNFKQKNIHVAYFGA